MDLTRTHGMMNCVKGLTKAITTLTETIIYKLYIFQNT